MHESPFRCPLAFPVVASLLTVGAGLGEFDGLAV